MLAAFGRACRSITRLPHKAATLHTHHVTCSFTSHATQVHNEFWAQCAKSSRLPICSRPPTTASSTTARHSLNFSGSLGFAARLSRALRHQGRHHPTVSKEDFFTAQGAGTSEYHTILQPVTWPVHTLANLFTSARSLHVFNNEAYRGIIYSSCILG